jgi:hypothetical protein
MMVATKVHKNLKNVIFGFAGHSFSLIDLEESNKKVNA